MSDLLKSVEELSPERRALFELLLKEKQQQRRAAQTQTIPRRRSLDSAPLSFSQQRLWFLNQLEPDSPVYSIPAAVRWSDPLNVYALLRSIHEIIRRHEILRATFVAQAGQPLQIIVPSLSVPMPLIDLQALGAAEREDEVVRLAAEEARRPFDLAHGPLIRFTLLRLGGQEHVLLLTMHHIVSDAWSTKILIRELATLYRAFCAGLPASLPDLPIQYTDFAAWQQQWLHGEVLEKQLAYWRRALDGVPALLELPGDRPRPAIQGFRGAQQPIALPGELSAGLMALSRQPAQPCS